MVSRKHKRAVKATKIRKVWTVQEVLDALVDEEISRSKAYELLEEIRVREGREENGDPITGAGCAY